ncbi:MAG: Gfo/Idh/MocA family oxidoreductase [Planctomycetota bacterium]
MDYSAMIKLGIIGYGDRANYLTDILLKVDNNLKIQAVTDIRSETIKAKYSDKLGAAHFYTDADQMLRNEPLDGVIVATRCSSHTPMASKVLEYNLPLFLEKPVSISIEQIDQLSRYIKDPDEKVVVSFPLRVSPLLQKVKQLIESGVIGDIAHVIAHNYVPYGRVYYADWYRDSDETGGMLLQKATHDFDYINYLLEQTPVRIAAMSSRQVFGGDMPAGLTCYRCNRQDRCPEGPPALKEQNEMAGISKYDHYCLFGQDIKHSDNDSVLIEYQNSVQVSYTQNFFARCKAAGRGATLVGYKGTLRFDWYKELIEIISHHSNEITEIRLKSGGEHHGGDAALCRNFINLIRNRQSSRTPLHTGLLSAYMCLLAQKSATSKTFMEFDTSLIRKFA